jgi:hypothetical protein
MEKKLFKLKLKGFYILFKYAFELKKNNNYNLLCFMSKIKYPLRSCKYKIEKIKD